ncbi:MAG: PCRF domain-containing protein, partial [Firmicutes bacterium]|nr:PCRF domain-containing protein [Bacillota bacterium]
MFDRLQELVNRYEELGFRLNEPQVIGDQALWQKMMREHAGLMPLVETYQRYKKAKQDAEEAKLLLEEEKDEELRQLAKEELAESREVVESLEQELKILLLPKDPNDEKNVFVEIRGGA